MTGQRLKLKQASAVLEIHPKELQNLVQFGVVKPASLRGTYFFDAHTLLAAKIASHLKTRLGTRTAVLTKLMTIFSQSQEKLRSRNPKYIVFYFSVGQQGDPIKVGVPVRDLGEEIKERMNKAGLYKDKPRGRKRKGWKKEFLNSLSEAAKEIGEISEEEILQTVRGYRREKRAPEITIAAED
jgi:hypothetical protein